MGGHRGEAVFRVGSTLGPPQVRRQYQSAAVFDDVAYGGEGGNDPRVIGNIPLIVEGDVEIDTAKDPFALELDVFYGQFC